MERRFYILEIHTRVAEKVWISMKKSAGEEGKSY